MIVPQPNPQALSAGDLRPAMLGRPVHLRPGPLPRRVRYQFKSDAEVLAAAEVVRATLLDESAASASSSAPEFLMVQPGVWPKVVQLPVFKDAK